MELFYQLNLQSDITSTFEVPAEFVIIDSAYPLSDAYNTSFTIEFEPKGRYVPKVLEVPVVEN